MDKVAPYSKAPRLSTHTHTGVEAEGGLDVLDVIGPQGAPVDLLRALLLAAEPDDGLDLPPHRDSRIMSPSHWQSSLLYTGPSPSYIL